MAELDRYHDIWHLVLKCLSDTDQNKKSVLLPIATVSRRISVLALQEIWSEISSFYPLVALFSDRSTSYQDWESEVIAQAKYPACDVSEFGGGGLHSSPSRWSRFNYYASLVLDFTLQGLNVNGVLETQVTLLPIHWLAAAHPAPLLSNLVSITITLDLFRARSEIEATRLPGAEWSTAFFSIIPPTLQHAKIAWFNNVFHRDFTHSVTGYVRDLLTSDSQGYTPESAETRYDISSALPGDYLAAVPRLSSLVSLKGLPLSTHMLDILAGLPFLSEISLYHTPEETILPQPENDTQLNDTPPRFLYLKTVHIVLVLHNTFTAVCPILSQFPIGRLESIALEFVNPKELLPPLATQEMFILLGNRAHALRRFHLVVDVEKWNFSPPPMYIEGETYALAPWSSLSCLLNCHKLRSVVVKCAGMLHGCELDSKNIHDLGNAWPHPSELCITETFTNTQFVNHICGRTVVDMVGLEALSRACPQLQVLKLTLRVGFDDDIVDCSGSREGSLPLQLGLGYSMLLRNDTMNIAWFVPSPREYYNIMMIFSAARSQLLSFWPGLYSLRTDWKKRTGVVLQAIYLARWRQVIEDCGPSVNDAHDTSEKT
ncbi:hypothetical protein FRC09_002241 [Ceratobasidium sp. 395]|nr:hypothetical protein FRC09_002241 [Ceratobasidium sp. 395]